jgi:hypothetical protein
MNFAGIQVPSQVYRACHCVNQYEQVSDAFQSKLTLQAAEASKAFSVSVRVPSVFLTFFVYNIHCRVRLCLHELDRPEHLGVRLVSAFEYPLLHVRHPHFRIHTLANVTRPGCIPLSGRARAGRVSPGVYRRTGYASSPDHDGAGLAKPAYRGPARRWWGDGERKARRAAVDGRTYDVEPGSAHGYHRFELCVPLRSEVRFCLFGSEYLLIRYRVITDAMYASLPGSRLKNVTLLGEMWSVPCTAEVNVSLSFGGVRYPVHPLDISAPLALLTGDASQEGCVGLWRSIDNVPINPLPNPLDMILGAAFRESRIFGCVSRHLTDRSEKRIHGNQLRDHARAVIQQRQRAIRAAVIDYERHCARVRRVRGGALDSGGNVGNFTSGAGDA